MQLLSPNMNSTRGLLLRNGAAVSAAAHGHSGPLHVRASIGTPAPDPLSSKPSSRAGATAALSDACASLARERLPYVLEHKKRDGIARHRPYETGGGTSPEPCEPSALIHGGNGGGY